MKERRQIVERWRKGEAASLITLVQAKGSSYRQPGARMLVGQRGEFVGTISGGCLETEMARKAAWLAREGAVLQHISTHADETSEFPFGLGCGGVLDLLIEPATTPEFEALMQALQASLEGGSRHVFTWMPSDRRRLGRVVLDEQGAVQYASAELPPGARLDARAWQLGLIQTPSEVVHEHVNAPQRLIVVGAGDDARPLVGFAAQLGWEVLVLDGRRQLARPERFPEATSVRMVPSGSFDQVPLRAEDAVVVMTHSYEQDLQAVSAFWNARPRYLGLLGARKRSALLLSEVAETSGASLADCCAAVHAPIGLDLGGDGPEAIALAIVAEVQACCMGKASGPLRLTQESIGEFVEQGLAERPGIASQCAL